MGVERMGDESAEADAELLAMTVECLSGCRPYRVSGQCGTGGLFQISS